MSYRNNIGVSLTGSLENVLDAYYSLKRNSSYLFDYGLNYPNQTTPEDLLVDKSFISSNDHNSAFLAEEFLIVNHKNDLVRLGKKKKLTQTDNLFSLVFHAERVSLGMSGIDDLLAKLAAENNLTMNFVRQGEEKIDTEIKIQSKNSLYGKIAQILFKISPKYYIDDDVSPPKKIRWGIKIELNPVDFIHCSKEKKTVADFLNKKFIISSALDKLTEKFYASVSVEQKIEKMIVYTDINALDKLFNKNPFYTQNSEIKDIISQVLLKEYHTKYAKSFSQKPILDILEVLQKHDFSFTQSFNKFKSNGNFQNEIVLMEKLTLSLEQKLSKKSHIKSKI